MRRERIPLHRMKVKNFVVDQKSKDPTVILEDTERKRSVTHLTISLFELPKLMSTFYKINEDRNDIYHAFAGMSTFRNSRIIIHREGPLQAELEVKFLFFVIRRIGLNHADAIILSMLKDIPLYVESTFASRKVQLGAYEQPTPQNYYRSVLEKWNPEKTDNIRSH